MKQGFDKFSFLQVHSTLKPASVGQTGIASNGLSTAPTRFSRFYFDKNPRPLSNNLSSIAFVAIEDAKNTFLVSTIHTPYSHAKEAVAVNSIVVAQDR